MDIPWTYIHQLDRQTLKRLVRNNAHGKVLDVGCGSGKIREWLNKEARYTGMDARPGTGVDVVGDVHQLPCKNDEYDTVLCTSVLEHVADADQVISEMYRVLRPGGKLILTIPFIHHYHQDPEDYRRLSHVGLSHLLKRHNFDKVETYQNYGVFAVVEYSFFCVLVHARRENLFVKRWYLLPYYFLIGVLFAIFKIVNYIIGPLQQFDTSFYVGTAAVAAKPSND